MSVIHSPCPKCGSRNNLATWEDGSQKCFTPGCDYQVFSNSSNPFPTMIKTTPQEIEPVIGEAVEIKGRRIPKESNNFFGYIKGTHGGEAAFFWPIYDNQRRLTGYKIRKKNKQFIMHGSNDDSTFLGQEKWNSGGKLLVIFEGEYDCLSYHAVRKNWPCVSLPNGVESGHKIIKAQLSWLLKFDEVILCYDNDEHGQKAVKRDIQLLPPRKGKIGVIEGHKDANEALMADDTKSILNMVWNSKEYEPDGIINASKLLTEVLEDPNVDSAEYPYSFLNDKLQGLRKNELLTVCAGTGVGKSTFVSEIAYDLLVRQNQTIGVISLEENLRRTARRFIGINLNHPIHINKGAITDEQIEQAFKATLGTGRLWLYDHFGSLDCDVLLNRIRYCIVSLGCDWVIFDHLSILVSGSDESNEVKAIDRTMTKLRSLVEETGAGLILVSHLRRPQGNKGYEDGQQTSLSSLRGSSSIGCLSDIVIGLERDQQDEDSDGTTVRVLKNRFSGWVGQAGKVKYNENSGRMVTLEDKPSFIKTNGAFESDF